MCAVVITMRLRGGKLVNGKGVMVVAQKHVAQVSVQTKPARAHTNKGDRGRPGTRLVSA